MYEINETGLGEEVEKILKEKHWSMRKAALKTGFSASYISKIVNRKLDGNPKPETLDQLASGLGVDRLRIYKAANRVMAPTASVEESLERGKYEQNSNSTFDIGKAIDNDEYMTNHGKQLTDKEKAMLKALFGE